MKNEKKVRFSSEVDVNVFKECDQVMLERRECRRQNSKSRKDKNYLLDAELDILMFEVSCEEEKGNVQPRNKRHCTNTSQSFADKEFKRNLSKENSLSR